MHKIYIAIVLVLILILAYYVPNVAKIAIGLVIIGIFVGFGYNKIIGGNFQTNDICSKLQIGKIIQPGVYYGKFNDGDVVLKYNSKPPSNDSQIYSVLEAMRTIEPKYFQSVAKCFGYDICKDGPHVGKEVLVLRKYENAASNILRESTDVNKTKAFITSLIGQTLCQLMVLKKVSLQFEHGDLHPANILMEKVPAHIKFIVYRIFDITIKIPVDLNGGYLFILCDFGRTYMEYANKQWDLEIIGEKQSVAPDNKQFAGKIYSFISWPMGKFKSDDVKNIEMGWRDAMLSNTVDISSDPKKLYELIKNIDILKPYILPLSETINEDECIIFPHLPEGSGPFIFGTQF